jgi:hypothetical protein
MLTYVENYVIFAHIYVINIFMCIREYRLGSDW